MTRAQQNTLILNSITKRLQDLPNVQQIISAKFDEWFRNLVAEGAQLLAQGQAPAPAAGGEQGGGAPAEGAAPEGAPA